MIGDKTMMVFSVILTKGEESIVKQLAEEHDMDFQMVLKLIFQQGMDKVMEERDHE
jgi:hypothetical protein